MLSVIKILVTRKLFEEDIKYISDKLTECIGNRFMIVSPENFDEESICREIKDADILLGPYVTESMLKEASNLKLIQIPWTGMDTFNFEAVKNSNVPVCNSHSNAAAVAEFGIALVLDLIKKVSYHDRKMRQGDWNRNQKPLNLKSSMLSSKIICVLGYGNIGRRIGKLVNAFGAKVIAVDDRMNYSNEVQKVYAGSDWLEAICQADICICTLPLTPKTKRLINDNTISKMKKGCMLINLSRADIFDEDALYKALVEGYVSGFASDVWWNSPKRNESESYVSTYNKFEQLENVILSPHRAGFVENALPHLDDAIINLVSIFECKPLINVVDVASRY